MDEIEEIKKKIDIVDFIAQYVSLKKAGRNFKALCPFHQEKTPSFIVSPERQIWHCFGACGEGGDIFTFLMKWENLEFYEALKILAQKAGVRLKSKKLLTGQAQKKEKIYEINHLASEFYHFLLISHKVGKKALDYLSSRSIKRESVKKFSLGYAPASWRSLLPFLKKKGYSEEEIEKAGLIIKSNIKNQISKSYYDRFRGRVVFTLKDHRGNIVGFSGRTLDPEVREAKYINTPETLVYHKGDLLYGLDMAKKATSEADEVIVTEGEFDVISSHQVGIKNIVAIKGSALTENHARLLKRFAENVTLALDADLAGDAAARRGIEIADREGLFVKVIKVPRGDDPDSLIRKGADLWQKIVKKSIPVYDFFLSSTFSRLKGESPQQKKKIGQELLPIWAQISDPIVQAHYIKILAKKLEVTEESIITALAKFEKNLPARPAGGPAGRQGAEVKKEETLLLGKERSREEMLEEYFLALLLKLENIDKFFKIFFEEKGLDGFQNPPIKKILQKLKEFLDKAEEFEITSFARQLPKELLPTLDKAYLQNIEENLKEEKERMREIKKVFKEIRRLFFRRKLKELATKIKEKKAKEEFKALTAQLKNLEKGDLDGQD